MAYATIEELALRWRDLSPKEQVIAGQLLDDAAVIIDAAAGDRLESIDTALLSIVSCDMVRRAMMANGNSFALGSVNDTAEAWTPYEAAGSVAAGLWLTYDNKRLLGIYSGRYFSVPAKVGYDGEQ